MLSEVKATNEHLSKKLEKLEEKVAKLQEGPPTKKIIGYVNLYSPYSLFTLCVGGST